LKISFYEAAFGKETEIEIPKMFYVRSAKALGLNPGLTLIHAQVVKGQDKSPVHKDSLRSARLVANVVEREISSHIPVKTVAAMEG
jgi:hypothetical protein